MADQSRSFDHGHAPPARQGNLPKQKAFIGASWKSSPTTRKPSICWECWPFKGGSTRPRSIGSLGRFAPTAANPPFTRTWERLIAWPGTQNRRLPVPPGSEASGGFDLGSPALGELLHAQGKLDEAADCLREALRLRPDDNEVRSVLGRVRHDQNKLTEAETCFRRVLGSNRSSPDAHFDLGSVLQSQQKLDEAVGCYRAALELQPGHAPAHNNLGTILKERSLLAEATGHFRAALFGQARR